MKQRTIAKEIILSGVGLHTGHQTEIRIKPASIGCGIIFIRVDLEGKPIIKIDPSSLEASGSVPRCTTVGRKNVLIHTIEHLLSVLRGLSISNLIIEINNDEVPGMDGSGLDFLKAIQNAGIVEQEAEQVVFAIKEPIAVSMGDASIAVYPDSKFKISYTLDYPHPLMQSQFFSSAIDQATFEKDIAPCRTFCMEKEIVEIRKLGLGQGANYQNSLVVGDKGVIDNTLRFANEFARHKVLDVIGDLSLLGMPIQGHVVAVKSGHNLNILLLRKIIEQKERYERKGIVNDFDITGINEIGIKEIMKILPHRYPFLLVDRVIEIEKGKRAVGIKNVTINDNFFQGHFPTRPVMPGVMMVEAMAQTAGVVVLTSEAHHGKVAFFMSVDKVKFRKVVSPGDQLIMEIEVLKDKERFAQIAAKAKVNGEVVAEAEMVFSFTDASFLN